MWRVYAPAYMRTEPYPSHEPTTIWYWFGPTDFYIMYSYESIDLPRNWVLA